MFALIPVIQPGTEGLGMLAGESWIVFCPGPRWTGPYS